ncbi:hypothetical protein U1Q18_012412 [Sarracenia purpurea var. burkii]
MDKEEAFLHNCVCALCAIACNPGCPLGVASGVVRRCLWAPLPRSEWSSPEKVEGLIREAISVRTTFQEWIKTGSFDEESKPLVRADVQALSNQIKDICYDLVSFNVAKIEDLRHRINRMKRFRLRLVCSEMEATMASEMTDTGTLFFFIFPCLFTPSVEGEAA